MLILEPPAGCDLLVTTQAAAISFARLAAEEVTETDVETAVARALMFMFRSGSAASCQVAMQPTKFRTGVEALRALCRFAKPLARPEPRCRRVVAGLRQSLA